MTSGPVESKAPVYLRVPSWPEDRDRVRSTLLEFDGEGFILREVGLAADGTPVYVTRPGEYGRFNDSPMPRTPPGTPAFEDQWGALGERISREEFEGAFDPADATLPHTLGGTPIWVSDVVSWGCILLAAAAVVGIIVGLSRLFGLG